MFCIWLSRPLKITLKIYVFAVVKLKKCLDVFKQSDLFGSCGFFIFWLKGQSGYSLLLLTVQSVSFPAWLRKAG